MIYEAAKAESRRLRALRLRFDAQSLICTLVLLVMGLLVLYPLITILVNSFQISQPGGGAAYGIEGWVHAFESPILLRSIVTTLNLTFYRQAIALPVALLFVWLIARTDLPCCDWLEFMFWVAFFLPTLSVVQGYILMFDPQYGVINKLLAKLPFLGPSTFDIFSFWGIVFAHLATNTIAIKVMLLTPVFRNMDGSLEDSAQICGSTPLGTFVRITVPLMAPAVLVVLLLSTIRALETFEIEMVLGAPRNIYVYSMQVYYLIYSEPPEFGPATALAVMVLLLIVPLVIGQILITRKRYTTLGVQNKASIIRLGFWRWPAFVLVAGVATFTTIIPTLMLLTGTFMKLWGFFNLPEPWTIQHWQTVLSDPIFVRSLINTATMSAGAALLGAVWCLIVSYIVVRTQFAGRYLLDFLSWLPFALPGVILGLGYLWMFLYVPFFRLLYGSLFMLILVLTLSAMTSNIQILRSNLLQIGADLEEASRVTGSSWFFCFRTIILPLVARTAFLAAVFGFAIAARNISHVALLSSSTTRPLALLQLDYIVEGRYEPAGVVGLLLLLLTVGVALLIRKLGFRIGAQHGV